MTLLRDLVADLRFGVRLLRRSPVFAVVATVSLALGIGGATSVFVLLNAIVLRTLPVPDAGELYLVRVVTRQEHGDLMSAPAFARARDGVSGRAELCAATAARTMQLRMDGDAAPTRGAVQLVSGEYFSVLRQRPQLGRLFAADDNVELGAHPVAVVSDAYWRRTLAGSPQAVGRTIAINGMPFTIVGVAAPGFFGTTLGVRNPDVWIPFVMQASVHYAGNASDSGGDEAKPWAPQPQISWLNVFARVQPAFLRSVAVSLTAAAQQEAQTLRSSGGQQSSGDAPRVVLESAAAGISPLRRDTASSLLVLLAMVGVLLAIACGNVAGLLLSRAANRDREVAIRLAIGASRGRVVRQMLAETLLLGVAAGALGITIAVWTRDVLLRLFVPGARSIDLNTALDWRVLGFAFGMSVLTGVVCGVIPALRGTHVAVVESIKEHARSVGTGRRGRVAGRALVAIQMAFCLLLLVVAGLFARSLESLARADVGFDRDHVLVAGLDVEGAGYTPAERLALYSRILERIGRVPGVQSVSLSANGPLTASRWTSGIAVDGYTPRAGERLVTNEEEVVGPYFATVGLHLVDGHFFEPQDHHANSHATIVNETMARKFFAGGRAVGKHWSYGGSPGSETFTIVGVVEDARYRDAREVPPPMAYHPAEFDPQEVLIRDLEIRTAGSPAILAQTVRSVLAESEPRLPVTEVLPLSERLTRGLSKDRLVAELTSAFGVLALLLAALGLYGTTSYGISRRTAELGLRMALGAERASVLTMVLREALAVVLIGAAVGAPLAFAAARSVGTLLYGVPPADVLSYAGAAVVLVTVSAVAAYLPAYRASRIEPLAALNRS